MRSSVNIGRIFGIKFEIHVTFFLLLAVMFFSDWGQRGLAGAAVSTLFLCAIFVCVVIHELGHSLVARRFGKQARSITLLPIGGVASLDSIPEKPSQEIAMAIVGPLINLVIAAGLYLVIGGWTGEGELNLAPTSMRGFFGGLMGVNVMLAVFNLIPALPMDGGRVLRAILATRMDYVRATGIAAFVGQAIATFFIVFGLFRNFWLAFVGLFIYAGADSEKRHASLQSLLRKVSASEAMTCDFVTLRPDQPIRDAVEQFYQTGQEDYPVVDGSHLSGLLTHDCILAGVREKGVDAPVAEVMDRDVVVVRPETSLEEVCKAMVAKGKTSAIVVDAGQIKGIVPGGPMGMRVRKSQRRGGIKESR